ncbi:hypothetical protein [Cohnella sp. GCM10012308]|uniref:hypothetical protein n=1 Tax=Cohnella sp. GCM10012308 TaxID=3317329 RepID=UPI003619B60C
MIRSLEKTRDRYKFYLFAYLTGYLAELAATGVPNLLSLLPVKLFGFLFVFVFGNAFYKGAIERENSLTVKGRVAIRVVLLVPILLLLSILESSYNISVFPEAKRVGTSNIIVIVFLYVTVILFLKHVRKIRSLQQERIQ